MANENEGALKPLEWDQVGEKIYESGVSKGVLYLKQEIAVAPKGEIPGKEIGTWYGTAWNGLTNVTESPEGADLNDLYADNIKYASLRAAETFGGTIEAYTYPPVFAQCDGTRTIAEGITIGQQPRKAFGLCYRTEIGNDENQEFGYKLHLVYNSTCSPSEKAYETINDSPDAITFSWEFKSTPVAVAIAADEELGIPAAKPTSILVIDSTKIEKAKLKILEDALYGTTTTYPYLPSPDRVLALIA